MKFKILFLAAVLMTGSTAAFSLDFGSTGKAAIIPLSGAIQPSSGGFSTGGITPAQVRDLNQRAENRGADAVVYEVNSGGGAVVASKEVMREIESVDVPTVCRFRDLAASGAYLASLGCDSVVADSASLTGSIGVRGSYLEVSGLMEKLGIDYVNITAGKYKTIGSQYMNTSDEQKQLLREKSQQVHQEFVSLVNESRGLTAAQVSEVRTGEPFLGTRAKELGLVDELGGRETAVEEAESLTGKELETFEVREQPGFNIFSLLTGSVSLTDMLSLDAPLKAIY